MEQILGKFVNYLEYLLRKYHNSYIIYLIINFIQVTLYLSVIFWWLTVWMFPYFVLNPEFHWSIGLIAAVFYIVPLCIMVRSHYKKFKRQQAAITKAIER